MRIRTTLFLFLLFTGVTATAQKWLWGAVGSGTCETWGTAADNLGNGFVTGPTGQYMIFGQDTITSRGLGQFVVKYDSNGNYVWGRAGSGGGGEASGTIVAADNTGGAYIAGGFEGVVNFGSDTLSMVDGSSYAYIVKYNAKGNVAWAMQAHQTDYGRTGITFVSADAHGYVYVVGTFSDTISFRGDTLRGDNNNGYVMKMDSNGSVIWLRQFSGTYYYSCRCVPNSVACDGLGNVYVTGDFADTVSFGKDTLIAGYSGEVFLAKYDVNGNEIWAKQSTGKASAYSYAFGNSVVVDGFGNAYVLGPFRDTVSFGNIKLINNVTINYLFLTKYDSSGNVMWAKQSYESSGEWGDNEMAIDDNNRIYMVEDAGGGDTITFCNKKIGGINDGDLSVIQVIDTSGNTICSTIANAGGDDQNGIACSPSGKYVYLGGDIFDTATFGSDFLAASGGNEPPFIARWEPCLSVISPEAVNELQNKTPSVSLFPNPTMGRFTIQVNGISDLKYMIVYNVLGQVVYSQPLQSMQGTVEVNLGNQPSGIYCYKVITSSKELSGKFVIQN